MKTVLCEVRVSGREASSLSGSDRFGLVRRAFLEAADCEYSDEYAALIECENDG